MVGIAVCLQNDSRLLLSRRFAGVLDGIGKTRVVYTMAGGILLIDKAKKAALKVTVDFDGTRRGETATIGSAWFRRSRERAVPSFISISLGLVKLNLCRTVVVLHGFLLQPGHRGVDIGMDLGMITFGDRCPKFCRAMSQRDGRVFFLDVQKHLRSLPLVPSDRHTRICQTIGAT